MKTIQTMISDSLKENTGINMCDSGGVKGRLWQQNQSVASFDDQPVVMVDIWDIDDICISYDIYHFLTAHLDVTEQSETLTSGLYTSADAHDSYHDMIDEFLDSPNIDIVYEPDNTYNHDSILSTDIQFAIFEYESDYSIDHYIILQIHTGADIRGGYTIPHIYRIVDINYFCMGMVDVVASCGCGTWSSDDCGYNWYSDQENGTNAPDNWVYDDETSLILCKRCGEPVVFGVMESW